jgi:hypothetical protein
MFVFYDLATKLAFIEEMPDTPKYSDVWYDLANARETVEQLINNAIVPVRTCRAAASGIIQAINKVVPEEFLEAARKDKDEVVAHWRLSPLRRAVREFQTVLAAELNIMDTYSVSQKGAYSTSDLIEHAELLIPDSLRGLLPKQSLLDIQQAGKCIAYDVPTGAAFHILRATEAVIRAYYQHVTGTLPKPQMRNWGAYVKNLAAAGADPKITGYIDHLRELYRNPVFHPEDNLTPEEAQMFLGACVSAICQMLISMRDTAPKLTSVAVIAAPIALPTVP